MEMEQIGRYKIEKKLGAGSMAVVYKAVDPVIGRTVAIKTIKIDSSIGFEHDELRERFYREAKNAGILNHPNIVTIFDIGAEGETDYIVMEFVEGEPLSDWLAKNPIPPLQQTIDIIEQIAAGLDFAAGHGIIHRDIKPANILLTQNLAAKIADFGIAKLATSKLTQTGSVIGSPAYMSPEQAMGKTLDGRSDIFSLGVIFYEMLTGEKPFNGTNPTTIIYKILHEEPVAPQQLNVTLHPAFNEIVGRMLAKDPDKRYQSCAQLIHDLKNYASMTVRAAGPEIPAPAAMQKPEQKGGGRGRAITFGLLVMIAMAAAGYFLYLKPRQSGLQESAKVQATPPAPIVPGSKEKAVDLPGSKAAAPQTAPDKQPIPEERPAVTIPPNQTMEAAPEKQATAATLTPSKKAAPAKEAVDKTTAKKQAGEPASSAAETSGRAEVRLEYAGAAYPVTVYDGAAPLKELSASNPSVQIAAGKHQFRLVSDDGFVDQKLPLAKLKTDEVYTISVPAICSAFIDVPNDAYDGCVIQLDGRTISGPYPVQISKMAAGNHKIVFRWDSGKYVGKELVSSFSGEANHHYRIRGEPAGEKVVVQQIR